MLGCARAFFFRKTCARFWQWCLRLYLFKYVFITAYITVAIIILISCITSCITNDALCWGFSNFSAWESHTVLVRIAAPGSFPRESDPAGPVQGWRICSLWAFALIEISWIVQNFKVINASTVKNNCPSHACFLATQFLSQIKLLSFCIDYMHWLSMHIQAYVSSIQYFFKHTW